MPFTPSTIASGTVIALDVSAEITAVHQMEVNPAPLSAPGPWLRIDYALRGLQIMDPASQPTGCIFISELRAHPRWIKEAILADLSKVVEEAVDRIRTFRS